MNEQEMIGKCFRRTTDKYTHCFFVTDVDKPPCHGARGISAMNGENFDVAVSLHMAVPNVALHSAGAEEITMEEFEDFYGGVVDELAEKLRRLRELRASGAVTLEKE